jgi:hypothetical protein
MKNIKTLAFFAIITAMTVSESCVKDLDRSPVYDITN